MFIICSSYVHHMFIICSSCSSSVRQFMLVIIFQFFIVFILESPCFSCTVLAKFSFMFYIVPPCILIELCHLSFSIVILRTYITLFWLLCSFVLTRETRERALLTGNWGKWGLKEYIWTGSLLGWFAGLVMPVQEIFVLPWLLQSAQYKIFLSSPYTISIHLFPSPSKLGRRPCWVAFLLVCVFSTLNPFYLGIFLFIIYAVPLRQSVFSPCNTHVLYVITSPKFNPVPLWVPLFPRVSPLPPSWLYIDTNYRNCL